MPRANIRLTDLGPVILRHGEALAETDAINSSDCACGEMRRGGAAVSAADAANPVRKVIGSSF